MKEPLVSIIMTVFNSRNFVSQAITSVLSQDFSDFEFIILDDASNDGSPEIISSYKDNRIRFVINHNNIGQTNSLNAAIKLSCGRYIARMDNDDVCSTNRLSLQVEFMEENPDVAVVGAWMKLIDDSGQKIGEKRYPLAPDFMHFLLSGLLDLPCIAHPTTMIRRKVLEETGYYNERYRICQDYDLWLRITKNYKIRNLPHMLLEYRLHKQSSSSKNKMLLRKEIKDIILSHISALAPGFDETKRNALVNYMLGMRQDSPRDGRMVLELRDSFLESINQTNGLYHKNNKRLNEIAEFFYLPALFLTNPILSGKRFKELCPRYRRWIASRKFLKACGRAIFWRRDGE